MKKKPKKARPAKRKAARTTGPVRSRRIVIAGRRRSRRPLPPAAAGPLPVNRFGWALEQMYAGFRVRRRGWTGNSTQSLELQRPDANSKMTLPYIYINTVTGARLPFTPQQSDILADDWDIAV